PRPTPSPYPTLFRSLLPAGQRDAVLRQPDLGELLGDPPPALLDGHVVNEPGPLVVRTHLDRRLVLRLRVLPRQHQLLRLDLALKDRKSTRLNSSHGS